MEHQEPQEPQVQAVLLVHLDLAVLLVHPDQADLLEPEVHPVHPVHQEPVD
jgi:hypothetical protein